MKRRSGSFIKRTMRRGEHEASVNMEEEGSLQAWRMALEKWVSSVGERVWRRQMVETVGEGDEQIGGQSVENARV